MPGGVEAQRGEDGTVGAGTQMAFQQAARSFLRWLSWPLRNYVQSQLYPVREATAATVAGTNKINAEINSINANLAAMNGEIGRLWNRVEFIRKELFFELRYGRRQPKEPAALEPRIISPAKLAAARAEGLKLNLGCGHVPLEGYINIDQRELPGVDVVAQAGNLPFETHSTSEMFSAHVLEHFPEQHLRRLLPYWRSLLKPRGMFRAIVPDGQAMLEGIADGSYPFEHFREVLFGAQEYEGDFHFNLFTPESLSKMLDEAGFEQITVPVKGRKNDICFEFEIVAVSRL